MAAGYESGRILAVQVPPEQAWLLRAEPQGRLVPEAVECNSRVRAQSVPSGSRYDNPNRLYGSEQMDAESTGDLTTGDASAGDPQFAGSRIPCYNGTVNLAALDGKVPLFPTPPSSLSEPENRCHHLDSSFRVPTTGTSRSCRTRTSSAASCVNTIDRW